LSCRLYRPPISQVERPGHLYEILRRFRPDLFVDNPDKNKQTLLIYTNDDHYYLVANDVLQRSLDVPRQERLKWLYGKDGEIERITPTCIHSENDVDIIVIPDDDERWMLYEERVKEIVTDEPAT
jgi:hypothetical protein